IPRGNTGMRRGRLAHGVSCQVALMLPRRTEKFSSGPAWGECISRGASRASGRSRSRLAPDDAETHATDLLCLLFFYRNDYTISYGKHLDVTDDGKRRAP